MIDCTSRCISVYVHVPEAYTGGIGVRPISGSGSGVGVDRFRGRGGSGSDRFRFFGEKEMIRGMER